MKQKSKQPKKSEKKSMAEIIDGKLVSNAVREKIKCEIDKIVAEGGARPGLAVILVGDNPASKVYVRNKHKACLEVGIESYEIVMDAKTTEEELVAKIDELNLDRRVNGILVQLPLPSHINEQAVISRISPAKDVDAFHHESVGGIMTGYHTFLPCTPAGIIEMLDFYNIDIAGKECVVIGRSNIVGKPMALLLLSRNGTVTVCHSRTQNLSEVTKRADILVAAIGKPQFVRADMVKPGAVVIDVGINRTDDGRLVGDVDFEGVSQVASYITPVPGGVGPMTITMLLKNALYAAKAASLDK